MLRRCVAKLARKRANKERFEMKRKMAVALGLIAAGEVYLITVLIPKGSHAQGLIAIVAMIIGVAWAALLLKEYLDQKRQTK